MTWRPWRLGGSVLLPTSPDFLHLQARRRGDRGGLVFREQRIAYGALAHGVDELAHWLARRGIGSGQRVGVMLPNTPAMPAATYALWGVGAASLPIAVRSTADEAAQLLVHGRAAALICDASRIDTARAAAASAGVPLFAIDAAPPLRPRLATGGGHRTGNPEAAAPAGSRRAGLHVGHDG